MKLLSTTEAAKMLGVSVATLNSWRWKGVGPAYIRLSHKTVSYDEDALRAYAKERVVIPSVRAFMEVRCATLQEA